MFIFKLDTLGHHAIKGFRRKKSGAAVQGARYDVKEGEKEEGGL